MNDLEQAVRATALEVARQRTPALAAVEDSHRLSEDLGLTSLDLAQLVAFLEIRFGLDPFSAQTSLSAVRTVGDLCQTYRRCAGEA